MSQGYRVYTFDNWRAQRVAGSGVRNIFTGALGGNDNQTKVLLHFDGTDASTTITDSNAGGSAHTWTANGNAQIDDAQSKFGGASGLFDGTGDYVSTPDHADFNLGSGAWTIDVWVNRDSATGRDFVCGQNDSVGSDASISFWIEFTAGNVVRAVTSAGAGATAEVNGTTAITDANWHHIAFLRTGNALRIFVDGVQEGGDTAFSSTVVNSTNALAVGRGGEITTNTFQGWIDEFRLSVGVARWTSNFTPPAVAYF